jgi:hypothetical protein
MLRSARKLNGCSIGTGNGHVGHIRDVYFDDWRWELRYLVVATGPWPTSRRVLLSPLSIVGADTEHRILRTGLAQAQVLASPDADTVRPVFRERELEFYRSGVFPHYWVSADLADVLPYGAAAGVPGALVALGLETDWHRPGQGDPHLRSGREVSRYYVHARDADIGHVADLLVDDGAWSIDYIVVSTGLWWPGRKVLVPVEWATRVSWDAHTVDVRLDSDAIALAPPFDPAHSLTPESLRRLDAYYGLPVRT